MRPVGISVCLLSGSKPAAKAFHEVMSGITRRLALQFHASEHVVYGLPEFVLTPAPRFLDAMAERYLDQFRQSVRGKLFFIICTEGSPRRQRAEAMIRERVANQLTRDLEAKLKAKVDESGAAEYIRVTPLHAHAATSTIRNSP